MANREEPRKIEEPYKFVDPPMFVRYLPPNATEAQKADFDGYPWFCNAPFMSEKGLAGPPTYAVIQDLPSPSDTQSDSRQSMTLFRRLWTLLRGRKG